MQTVTADVVVVGAGPAGIAAAAAARGSARAFAADFASPAVRTLFGIAPTAW
jgi:flavin-dependent dehydrogenase